MGFEPITNCSKCGDPFDVYREPGNRICDGCLGTWPAKMLDAYGRDSGERQALGKWLLEQQAAGRKEIPMDEIETVKAGIRVAFDVMEEARGGVESRPAHHTG